MLTPRTQLVEVAGGVGGGALLSLPPQAVSIRVNAIVRKKLKTVPSVNRYDEDDLLLIFIVPNFQTTFVLRGEY